MNHMDFVKGVGLGLIAGGIASLALSSGKRRRKKCKNHTIKAIGDVVENVSDMLGF